MKSFKQIFGFILLFSFIGFLVFKFNNAISGVENSDLITALAVVIVLMILFAVRRVLYH